MKIGKWFTILKGMIKISKKRAVELVVSIFAESKNPAIVIEKMIIETNFCWIIYYNSKEYIEKGTRNMVYLGNIPILVDKYTSKMFYVGGVGITIWQDIEFYRQEMNYDLLYIQSDSSLPVLSYEYEKKLHPVKE